MKEENAEHIVYSKSVIEFATVANEFCNFVEGQQSLTLKQFLSTLQKLLPLLYLKTSMLPDLSDENAETPEKYLSEVDYNFLLNKLSVKLGSYDIYLEVFDPGMQFSETPIESSISENLCDIYQDLKDFIFAYRMGTTETMSDALWECKNNFEGFWGQKLANVLRAIHPLLYGETLLEENTGLSSPEEAPRNKNWVSKHFFNQPGDEYFIDDEL
jgi:hypothetical protein